MSFEPEKIKKMGVLGETFGLPSIQFSSAETSSMHIQRALVGMRFR